MGKLFAILNVLLCSLFIISAAEQITLKLTDGTTIAGEVGKSSFNNDGVALMQNGIYGKRVQWNKISQESLKKLAEHPLAQKYVEPLIEWMPEDKPKERPAPKKLEIKQPPKIERPQPKSTFGALFQSPVSTAFLLLIYLANIYAGYEVAIYKNRKAPIVCAAAAVLPILGLILFIVMPPAPVKPAEELVEEKAAVEGEATEQTAEITAVQQASQPQQQPEQQEQTLPQTISFLRGQYTFNRRFFETKFSGFFKPVPGDEEKDKELVLVTLRGTYIGQRFTKISPNEVFLLVKKGNASEEIMIPFVEIKEVHIKHKDVPFNGN
ncbi:MAG: hypothetical protein ACP5MG_11940 [Verrucomicrobiia bacterium]|jgi:hypothetical protein